MVILILDIHNKINRYLHCSEKTYYIGGFTTFPSRNFAKPITSLDQRQPSKQTYRINLFVVLQLRHYCSNCLRNYGVLLVKLLINIKRLVTCPERAGNTVCQLARQGASFRVKFLLISCFQLFRLSLKTVCIKVFICKVALFSHGENICNNRSILRINLSIQHEMT